MFCKLLSHDPKYSHFKTKNGNAGFQGLVVRFLRLSRSVTLKSYHKITPPLPGHRIQSAADVCFFCHSGHEQPIIMSNNDWLSLIRLHPAASMFFLCAEVDFICAYAQLYLRASQSVQPLYCLSVPDDAVHPVYVQHDLPQS